MQFPEAMKVEKRWMVRTKGNKQPRSAYEKRPTDYEPPNGESDFTSTEWAWRWACPSIWATHAEMVSALNRQSNLEGPTFCLHHGHDLARKSRLVVFDFDKCIDANGVVDDAVVSFLFMFETFKEFSRSLGGIHAVVKVVDCPAFSNILGAKIGNCKVDVFCSNPVAVTGNVFGEFREVQEITFAQLEGLPFFVYKQPADLSTTLPEWWSKDPIDDIPPHLEHHLPMVQRCTAIQGQNGSGTLFKVACNLLRMGIEGREAEALLRAVPAVPEFSPKELRRTLECAFRNVSSTNEFNTETFCGEFSAVEPPPAPEPPEGRSKYGFTPIPCEVLETMDVRNEWLVEELFVEDGVIFVGGREKTFKTGLVVDLLISLASERPFLGKYRIPRRRRSVLFTAEIGVPAIQNLYNAIRKSKGIKDGSLRGVDVVASVPCLGINPRTGQPSDLEAINGLRLYFQDVRPELAVFDPLYFAMGGGAAVGDLYAIGEVLKNISGVCKDFGVQPVFCHHAKKNPERQHEVMELGDFYGSGIPEFARQWFLLSHREPFRNGVAKLQANVAGSYQGSRGVVNITIDEGRPDGIIIDKQWNVIVEQAEETEFLSVSEQTVLDCLNHQPDDRALTAEEMAIFLNASTKRVTPWLHEGVRSGKLQMVGKKFKINKDWAPN